MDEIKLPRPLPSVSRLGLQPINETAQAVAVGKKNCNKAERQSCYSLYVIIAMDSVAFALLTAYLIFPMDRVTSLLSDLT